jgi:hypothetical protein
MTLMKNFFSVCALFVVAGCGDAGTSPASTADMCLAISTEYATALAKAGECTPGAANTCTKPVLASFYCRCQTFVSGPTANLTAIAARFDAAGCVSLCTGLCAMPTGATCQADATSSTGGRCVPTQS